MSWAKSFREFYLEKYPGEAEQFERDLFRRGLHRRARAIQGLVRLLNPSFFTLEYRTLQYLGNARSAEEFRSELDSYRSEYRRHGGLLRNLFGVRLSGRRLMDLLVEVAPV